MGACRSIRGPLCLTCPRVTVVTAAAASRPGCAMRFMRVLPSGASPRLHMSSYARTPEAHGVPACRSPCTQHLPAQGN